MQTAREKKRSGKTSHRTVLKIRVTVESKKIIGIVGSNAEFSHNRLLQFVVTYSSLKS